MTVVCVLEQLKHQQYFIDGLLKQNLDLIPKWIRQDRDAWFIVSGPEREGKSTLTVQCAAYLDPTFNLDRICFTLEQFVIQLFTAPKYSAIILDEGHKYLASNMAMSKFNKFIVRLMTEIGYKNLIVFICIPSFFELQRYAAMHRSIVLLWVRARSVFYSFNKRRKELLYLLGKRKYDMYAIKPDYFGSFPSTFPLDKQEYEKKKEMFAGTQPDVDWKKLDKLIETLKEQKKIDDGNKSKEAVPALPKGT